MSRAFSKSFYKSKVWQATRQYILTRDRGLCRICGKPAEEVHHIVHLTPASMGDISITLNPDNLIAVCRDCHFDIHRQDAMKGRKEKAHQRIVREDGTYFDENGMLVMRQIALVYGPPRSGKTTYVREHMENGDCVVDVDALKAALHLDGKRIADDNLLDLALMIRDYIIQRLSEKDSRFDCKNVWIVGGFPKRDEREKLTKLLNAKQIFIATQQSVCEQRAKETNVYGDMQYGVDVVRKWFAQFEP